MRTFNLRHFLAVGLLLIMSPPLLLSGCGGSQRGASDEVPAVPSAEHIDSPTDPS